MWDSIVDVVMCLNRCSEMLIPVISMNLLLGQNYQHLTAAVYDLLMLNMY